MVTVGIHSNALRLLVLGAIVLVTGCQRSERVTVSGRVLRHDGTPLPRASVIARNNETGKWARGTTDADGHYELGAAAAGDGILPGVYGVTIMEDLGDSGTQKPTIPGKYVNQSTSKLQLTVTQGKSVVFDITLDPT
jgi:hypothetical protein